LPRESGCSTARPRRRSRRFRSAARTTFPLIAFQLDIAGTLRLAFLPVLLTLFLMSLLDTLGTLVGVGAAAGMLDEKGNFPQIEKPMTVDALASESRPHTR
jgi:xanthine/uracil/vitamin C permease (AzgA family)